MAAKAASWLGQLVTAIPFRGSTTLISASGESAKA
jgi:hypothetical protein